MSRDLSLLGDAVLVGSEKDVLAAYFRFHQDTLLFKADGLDDEQLRRAIVPSGLSMIGLVKHLTYVHASWFEVCFDDRLPEDLRLGADEWRVEDGETTTSLLAGYGAHVDAARALLERYELDDLNRGTSGGRTRAGQFNLRWIVVHMVEELSRHNGHADIVREQVDGVVGV